MNEEPNFGTVSQFYNPCVMLKINSLILPYPPKKMYSTVCTLVYLMSSLLASVVVCVCDHTPRYKTWPAML